jgi:ribosomal protein S18 acetylase RimI-like enzyme
MTLGITSQVFPFALGNEKLAAASCNTTSPDMMISTHRAGPADLEALVPLFDAYRSFYNQPSDPERAREWLRSRLRFGESVVFVAMRGAAMVGFTQLYPMYSSVRTARTWILNDLFVDAAVRRSGAGRALLDAAASFAREDGAMGISLETTQDNVAARGLYHASGWNEDATQWYSLAFP